MRAGRIWISCCAGVDSPFGSGLALHKRGSLTVYKIPRLPADAESSLPPQASPPAQAASPATAQPPQEHVPGFYSLSVQLTGFDEVELLGTGVGHLYLDWLYEVFPDVTRDLLA